MATVEKRGNRYRVRVRRQGQSPISKSSTLRKDAEAWARATEVDYETTPKAAPDPKQTTLGQLIDRYKDEITPTKEGKEEESSRLNALKKHAIAKKLLSEIKSSHWASYRDKRIKENQASIIAQSIQYIQAYVRNS